MTWVGQHNSPSRSRLIRSKPVLTSDSGVLGDNITNATNPSFSGIVDAGADVELRITTSGNPNTLTETYSLVGVADSKGFGT